MKLKALDIMNIGGGVIPELFGYELVRVLDNVQDPNTPALAARKITIEVTIKPQDDRESATVTTAVKSKLAGIMPNQESVFLTQEGGCNVAFVRNPAQTALDFGKLVEMDGQKEANDAGQND